MGQKPSAALILLRAEWFGTVVALPGLSEAMAMDAREMGQQLGGELSIDHTWLVSSRDELESALPEVMAASVDLFILAFQVWAEDYYLEPLARAIGGRPLAVWCYVPWQEPPGLASFRDVLRGSGPVGTLEGLGTLRNLGVHYLFTWGAPQSPVARRDLLSFAQAGRAWRLLHRARIGLLPARNEQMQSTFVDESRLAAEIGAAVLHFPVTDLKQASDNVRPDEVGAFVAELRAGFRIEGVDAETLEAAARCSLGLAHLGVSHKLDLLAMNDTADELHAMLGLRPCLYPRLIEEAGMQVGLEGDLGAAIAMLAQRAFSPQPLFFAEFWYWDETENTLVGGHAGLQNPALGKPGTVWIGPDYEYAQTDRLRGAHLYFVARPGAVTLLQVRATPQGWQAVAAQGEALDSQPRLEGYPHAVVRLAAPLDAFLRQVARVGSTQHWIMAYGDTLSEIRALCSLLHIPLEEIRA